jgi:hypothetical protein
MKPNNNDGMEPQDREDKICWGSMPSLLSGFITIVGGIHIRTIEYDPRGQQIIVTLIQVLEGSGQG